MPSETDVMVTVLNCGLISISKIIILILIQSKPHLYLLVFFPDT